MDHRCTTTSSASTRRASRRRRRRRQRQRQRRGRRTAKLTFYFRGMSALIHGGLRSRSWTGHVGRQEPSMTKFRGCRSRMRSRKETGGGGRQSPEGWLSEHDPECPVERKSRIRIRGGRRVQTCGLSAGGCAGTDDVGCADLLSGLALSACCVALFCLCLCLCVLRFQARELPWK